jgi:hypothetical protein
MQTIVQLVLATPAPIVQLTLPMVPPEDLLKN